PAPCGTGQRFPENDLRNKGLPPQANENVLSLPANVCVSGNFTATLAGLAIRYAHEAGKLPVGERPAGRLERLDHRMRPRHGQRDDIRWQHAARLATLAALGRWRRGRWGRLLDGCGRRWGRLPRRVAEADAEEQQRAQLEEQGLGERQQHDELALDRFRVGLDPWDLGEHLRRMLEAAVFRQRGRRGTQAALGLVELGLALGGRAAAAFALGALAGAAFLGLFLEGFVVAFFRLVVGFLGERVLAIDLADLGCLGSLSLGLPCRRAGHDVPRASCEEHG